MSIIANTLQEIFGDFFCNINFLLYNFKEHVLVCSYVNIEICLQKQEHVLAENITIIL
jgi:hypothetical protein